jgi:L-aminopeptidase/D-esterase-like protein
MAAAMRCGAATSGSAGDRKAAFPQDRRMTQHEPIGGAITDVPGIKAGHFTETRRPTGCTVVLTEAGATAAVDVRGAAPGTRETDLLDPSNTVEQVHAVLLTGGSSFGLAAATGVMRWLEERGFGLPVGAIRVPIVPAAVIFDLPVGDHRIRPDERAGHAACEAASTAPPEEGSVGAGTGATVGKLFGMAQAMKGGIGTASLRLGGITLGAIVVVNAVGDVIDPTTGAVVAGARDAQGRCFGTTAALLRGETPRPPPAGTNTTIGVVATDATLTKAQCRRLAMAAHDGLARSIDPIHTSWDGDTIFALATGRAGVAGDMMALGAAVPHVVAAAVLRAVRAARTVPPSPPGPGA